MSLLFKAGYAVLALAALAVALLVGVTFVVGLISGGSIARRACDLAANLESVAIYTASAAILCAVLSMYATGDHHLRITKSNVD